MSVRISPNLPANVVEIGNEISQARMDAINNGVSPTSGNPFTTVSYVTSRGYLTDAPSNGSEYVRKNGAWSVATGGGGGGSVAWGSITGTISSQTDLTSYVTGLGYLTDAPSTMGALYVRSEGAWLQFYGVTEAPNDGGSYVRNMSGWSNITGLGYQTASDVTTALGSYLPLTGGSLSNEVSVTGSGGTSTLGTSGSGGGAITVTNSGATSTMTVYSGGITFPDSTTQTTAYTGSSYSTDKIKADFIVNSLAGWFGYYGMFNFPALPMFMNNLTSNWGVSDGTNSIPFSYGYSSGSQMALYFSGSIGYSTISAYVNSTYSTYSVS